MGARTSGERAPTRISLVNLLQRMVRRLLLFTRLQNLPLPPIPEVDTKESLLRGSADAGPFRPPRRRANPLPKGYIPVGSLLTRRRRRA